jgi:FemAB-related protein (PEP-CTERM system-associated)
MLADMHAASSGVADADAVSVAECADGAEWDQFIWNQPSSGVEQLWRWREVYAQVFRQEPLYLVARREERVCGALPLVRFRSALFGRSLVSLPYANYAGMIASDASVAHALVTRAEEEAARFGASYVELRGIDRQMETLPFRQHKVGARLPLPASPDTLFAALDRKVRNQVRKATKEQLSVSRGGSDLIDRFYGVFARNMRDLGTPVFPKTLFTETLRQFGDMARVYVVRHGEVPIAAAIALGWRETVLVPWASSMREYRHLCGNMLMYWSMIEDAITSGHTVFDFGRSTPGGGTHHFKEQWGATDFPLHWEYVLSNGASAPDHGTSNPRMQRLIAMWQKLPLPVASFLGPRIVRHIP